MRIVVIQTDAMWTGRIEEQDFLVMPESLDMDKEEKDWFASGGDTSGKTFVEYLLSRGVVKFEPEIWTIRYMS